ncbi:hypothetical protein Q9251_02160 [Alkalihalobacillus macyae]|uniref:hypothetical protein n=1 Tax=Guptibacillus hwajinpoensis TaxID=208199 RepID=UPI00273B71F2|nr:hypothetical protein [Alkalihalobacillus macyae]MDP4549683.1 hypothetical protein [Alkalihalobacillus macyae]
MSAGKRFLITWLIIMVLMSIEFAILPNHVIVKGIALASTSMLVVNVMNRLYPSKEKTK